MDLLGLLMACGDYVVTGRRVLASILGRFECRERIVLYALGRYHGYALGARLRRVMERATPREKLFSMLELARKSGHLEDYRVVVVDEDRLYARVEVYGSIEALEPPGGCDRVCMLLAGEMGGAATALLGRYIVAREEECAASGSRACVFQFKPLEASVGHHLRELLVDLLLRQPLSMSELSRLLGVPESTVRWHLGYLERMRLVRPVRRGRRVYYYVAL